MAWRNQVFLAIWACTAVLFMSGDVIRHVKGARLPRSMATLEAPEVPGRSYTRRALLQLDPTGGYVWTSDATQGLCTVASDGVTEKWQPEAAFVKALSSLTNKLVLYKVDKPPSTATDVKPFQAAVHPSYKLVSSAPFWPPGPYRSGAFLGYNAPDRPFVFAPSWTLSSSGSVLGGSVWLFGVAPGTSEADVSKLAVLAPTPDAPLVLTYIDVKDLPSGYQWYQASQPIA